MDHHQHVHETAGQNGPHRVESLNRTAASATLHCLTGCAIGEVLGMVIGTAFALSNITTVALSILLAFLFGYSLTTLPLLRSGLALAAVVPLAFASDTFSITVMEIVDNAVMIWLPGAMDATLGDLLFWGALALSLVIAFFAAWPVNRYLIARGRGHAVVHAFHHGESSDAATVPALNVTRLAAIGIAAISFTVGVGVAGAALAERVGSNEMPHDSGHASSAPARLPNTRDYHSLLVNPANAQELMLGTHNGLYVSTDGGRRWRFDKLAGSDAMNLARPAATGTVWLAGHDVLKRSDDAGATWADVRPRGLPSLDIHAFAVHPRQSSTIYAAVAGRGLYRSTNDGSSFSLASKRVGADVTALAILRDGRILAGDAGRGLLESNSKAARWTSTLPARIIALAVHPRHSNRVLATGGGIALSTDGGHTWRSVLELPAGAGPVAWSQSNPQVAYAVGFNRTLYRSTNGGASWRPVR